MSKLFVYKKQNSFVFFRALIERKRELLVQEETEIATFQYDLAVARLDKELLLQQQKEEIIMLRVEGEREQQALKTKVYKSYYRIGVTFLW